MYGDFSKGLKAHESCIKKIKCGSNMLPSESYDADYWTICSSDNKVSPFESSVCGEKI